MEELEPAVAAPPREGGGGGVEGGGGGGGGGAIGGLRPTSKMGACARLASD